MTDRFFRPQTKGQIYYKIDWERMLQSVKELQYKDGLSEVEHDKRDIELLCKIATARALDNIYNYGLTTTTS
jgi:hypothetical protein